jgi:lipoprotein-anchoring transpeptidase ErfK/SrfK
MNWRGVWIAAAAATWFSTPASAQIGQWGLWGEPPERHTQSNLGALPPATKSAGLLQGGGRPNISPRAPKTTAFSNGFAPGSVIIDQGGRKLYYTLSAKSAYVYPIAVGKEGFTWTGVEHVSRINDWPDWIPPAEMRQRKPGLPVRMTGGVKNPLGAKAIYLGNTLYRIHGTNEPSSIGSATSSGCIRMHNADVVHLAGMVNTGTTVYVMKRLPKGSTIMPPVQYKPPQPQQQAPAEAAAPPAEGAPAEAAPPAGAAPAEPAPPAENSAPPPDQKI